MPKVSFDFNFVLKDKSRFFDRAHAKSKLTKLQISVLASVGAYTKTTMQRTLKRVGKKGNPSKPGTPPKHRMPGSAEGLRKIEFRLGKDDKSVKVGSVHLPRTRRKPTTPELHEFGGIVGTVEYRLTPTNETKWMFDPKNVAEYAGLQRSIRNWKAYEKRSAGNHNKKFGKKNPKTIDDFGLKLEKRQAMYPQRPFLSTGLSKAEKKFPEIVRKEFLKHKTDLKKLFFDDNS